MNLEEKVEYLMREVESLKQKLKKRLQLDNFAIHVSGLSGDEYNDLYTALQLLGAKKNEKYHEDAYYSLDGNFSSHIHLCVVDGVLMMFDYLPSDLTTYPSQQIISKDITDFISDVTYSLRRVHINDCNEIIARKCELNDINCVDEKTIIDILNRYIGVCPSCNKIFELDELRYSNEDHDEICENCAEQ